MAALSAKKFGAYAVLDAAPNETAAGATKLGAYALLDAATTEQKAAATKFGAYALLETVLGSTFFPEPVFFPGAAPGLFGGARFQPRWAYPVVPVPPPAQPIPPPRRLWPADIDDGAPWLPPRRFVFIPAGPPAPLTVAKLSAYALLDAAAELQTAVGVTKLGGFAVLDASIGEDTAAVTKLRAYGLLDASLDETTVGITRFGAYGLFDASLHETTAGVTKFGAYGLYITRIPPRPLPVGMAEYTTTTGTGAYQLRGPLPQFATLRSQLIDGAKVRYRATNGILEEVGEAIFDWRANRLIRFRAVIPAAPVDWPPGRKLIRIIEDYTVLPGGAAILPGSTLSIGISEYTTTTGTGPYLLRGPFPEFTTLRAQLINRAPVRYRATNGILQEIGEGFCDWPRNLLTRNRIIAPLAPIDWPAGRKLIYIVIED